MNEAQEGRDLQEITERYLEAQERVEQAAWNALASLREVNEIEAACSTQFSNGLRDIIAAIDQARAELGSIK
jgi:hypothetical protein